MKALRSAAPLAACLASAALSFIAWRSAAVKLAVVFFSAMGLPFNYYIQF
jgi:hypothetical protein